MPTVVEDSELDDVRLGAGACSVSGCSCPGFMGSADLCSNCGHSASLHW